MNRKLLDDTGRVYAGFGFPPIDVDDRLEGSRVGDFMAAFGLELGAGDIDESAGAGGDPLQCLRQQLLGTARSIRTRSGPTTVLHALLLEDDQTLGRIAAKLHADPRDLELSLNALMELGWVKVNDSGPLKRYMVPGIESD